MGDTWIGPYGAMAELKCPAQLSSTMERSVSSEQTLGGRDVIQWGNLLGREWSLQMSDATQPHTVAAISELVVGESLPPWGFITPEMCVTNLVAPDGTAFRPGTFTATAVRTGSVTATDGTRFLSSLVPSSTGYTSVGMHPAQGTVWRCPTVMPGKVATFSIYASGPASSAQLRMGFFDAGNNMIANITETVPLTPAGYGRVHMTTTVPAGAAWVNLLVQGTTGLAGPALTFTDTPTTYTPGEGVLGVYVAGIGKSVNLISPIATYVTPSFTVKEIRRP